MGNLARAREVNSTGYIFAYSIASNGRLIARLFLLPTTSSGGSANSVLPSDFNDQFVTLTISSFGFDKDLRGVKDILFQTVS